MGFFKTKLTAPANGQLIPLEEVNDEVFASKMMGDGFAVIDHDGKVYAPIAGTVENIFPTKHAITLTNKKGVQFLIHIGIDTVDLKGEPFTMHVKQGDQVKQGDLLAQIDLAMLAEKDKDAAVIVVLPEQKGGSLIGGKRAVALSDTVFQY